MKVVTYLSFNGNCERAMRFYADALGGTLGPITTYGSSPMAAEMPADRKDGVMHVALDLGETTLMAADMPHDRPASASGFSLSIVASDVGDAEQLFAAISAGGKVTMPLQETFWAKRFGMVVDPFGMTWMVNCDV